MTAAAATRSPVNKIDTGRLPGSSSAPHSCQQAWCPRPAAMSRKELPTPSWVPKKRKTKLGPCNLAASSTSHQRPAGRTRPHLQTLQCGYYPERSPAPPGHCGLHLREGHAPCSPLCSAQLPQGPEHVLPAAEVSPRCLSAWGSWRSHKPDPDKSSTCSLIHEILWKEAEGESRETECGGAPQPPHQREQVVCAPLPHSPHTPTGAGGNRAAELSAGILRHPGHSL